MAKEISQTTRKQCLHEYAQTMDHLRDYIATKRYAAGLSLAQKKKIYNLTSRYRLQGETLMFMGGKKGSREVVTCLERITDIMQQYHSDPFGGHTGINNTFEKVSARYFWWGMKKGIKYFVSTCLPCQHFEPIKTQAPMLHPIVTEEPLELVCVDLIGKLPTTKRGHKYIMTIIDHFTKFVDLYPLQSKNGEGTGRAIKTFVRRWGAPKRLLSDQGREFCNKMNTELCQTLNIKRSVASAYHPQTNGLAERNNATIKQRIAKICMGNMEWDDILEDVAYSITTQRQGSTRYAPFFLMFGREPRTPIEMEIASEEVLSLPPETTEEGIECHISQQKEKLQSAYQQARENQKSARKKDKTTFKKKKARGVKTYEFHPGQLVLKKNVRKAGRKGGTLETAWTGPYKIMDIDQNHRVLLSSKSKTLAQRVPHDQLKPFKKSSLLSGDTHVADAGDTISVLTDTEGDTHVADVADAGDTISLLTDTEDTEENCMKVGPSPKKRCLRVCMEELTVEDMSTLKAPNWLNDKVINTYLKLLEKKFPHVYTISSYAATIWEKDAFPHLYLEVNLSKYEWILIPTIKDGCHWVLLCGHVPTGLVAVTDSLGGNNSSYIQLFRKFMSLREKHSTDLCVAWKEGLMPSGRQLDGHSCGPFVMLNALAIAAGLHPQQFTQQHATAMRDQVWLELLQAIMEKTGARERLVRKSLPPTLPIPVRLPREVPREMLGSIEQFQLMVEARQKTSDEWLKHWQALRHQGRRRQQEGQENPPRIPPPASRNETPGGPDEQAAPVENTDSPSLTEESE